MFIHAQSIDDLMHTIYERLLKSKLRVEAATKGANSELPGVLLELRKPRVRVSRTESKSTLTSCLGELLWYLAGTNDLKFIQYYLSRYDQFSDDNKTVFGGYGPRMFGAGPNDQFRNLIAKLREGPDTRKAVIQLFDAEDLLEPHKDVPCTCTLQFLVRRHRVNLVVYMRSNDAYRGLPHDIFAFTMLQEIMARSLKLELGTYKHVVGSLHLYDENRPAAGRFLNEGIQPILPMPTMPLGDPWPSIKILLKAEKQIRLGKDVDIKKLDLDPYWEDLIRVLQVFHFTKSPGNSSKIARLIAKMHSPYNSSYLKKVQAKEVAKEQPPQGDMFSGVQK